MRWTSLLGLLLLPFAALVPAACGGSLLSGSPSVEDNDASPAGDASLPVDGGLAPDAPTGQNGGVLYCPYGIGVPEPPPGSYPVLYDKACASASDCTIGLHYLNCCGSLIALGIRGSEAARFDAGICDGGGPTCDCASGPTLAEDGQRSADPWPYADVGLRCASGLCRTYVMRDQ